MFKCILAGGNFFCALQLFSASNTLHPGLHYEHVQRLHFIIFDSRLHSIKYPACIHIWSHCRTPMQLHPIYWYILNYLAELKTLPCKHACGHVVLPLQYTYRGNPEIGVGQ